MSLVLETPQAHQQGGASGEGLELHYSMAEAVAWEGQACMLPQLCPWPGMGTPYDFI